MNNSTISIGDVLTRPKLNGFVTHYGVVVGNNAVLHNTPEKGEHLATMKEFAASESVQVHRTGADPSSVVTRTRKILANPKKFHALFRNCEQTTSEVLSGIAKSPQLMFFGIIAVVGTTILLASCLRRR